MAASKTLTIEQEAARIPAEHTLHRNVESDLIVANARTCVEGLISARSLLEAELKKFDFARVTRLQSIASAYKKASLAVAYAEPSVKVDLHDALAKAWPLRRSLLKRAELAADEGLVPAKTVEAIAKGSGPLDSGNDLSELADLFTEHWETLGKRWGVTQAHLDEAYALAKTIKAQTRPNRQKALTPKELVAARLLRDRLFTLLWNARKELWPAAAIVWGEDEIDAKFPALSAARRESPSEKKAAPAPPKKEAPAPTPEPTPEPE